MKKFNIKQKMLLAAGVVLSSPTFAADGFDISKYFGAINLGGVAAAVGGIGVIVVGICMSEKGIGIAKRVIGKA